MIIISDREEKLSHQDFIERMYTSIDTEFALVSFAAYKVIEEYKKNHCHSKFGSVEESTCWKTAEKRGRPSKKELVCQLKALQEAPDRRAISRAVTITWGKACIVKEFSWTNGERAN